MSIASCSRINLQPLYFSCQRGCARLNGWNFFKPNPPWAVTSGPIKIYVTWLHNEPWSVSSEEGEIDGQQNIKTTHLFTMSSWISSWTVGKRILICQTHEAPKRKTGNAHFCGFLVTAPVSLETRPRLVKIRGTMGNKTWRRLNNQQFKKALHKWRIESLKTFLFDFVNGVKTDIPCFYRGALHTGRILWLVWQDVLCAILGLGCPYFGGCPLLLNFSLPLVCSSTFCEL